MASVLELFKEQSNHLNQECQQFQAEIKSLFDEIKGDKSTNEQLNRLCDHYSTSLNRICVETVIKLETKPLTNNARTAQSNDSKVLNKTEPLSTATKLYRCDKCDISYTAQSSLARHNRNKHYYSDGSEDEYDDRGKDNDCDDDFDYPDDDDMINKAYKCKLCDKSFPSGMALGGHISGAHRRHKSVVINDDTFCAVCDKSFSTVTTLKEHQLTVHSKVTPFICDQCGKAFKLKRWLNRHIRDDHDGYPVECSQCNKRFKFHSELRWHRNYEPKCKMNVDVDPFECDACDKSFTTSGGLKLHKLTHTEQKLFQCEYCLECFKLQSYLTQHIIDVHDKPWKCEHCLQTFRMKPDLMNHIKIMHGTMQNNAQQSSGFDPSTKHRNTKHLLNRRL